MESVRIGLIGCGYWGPNLLRNLVEIPGSDVVAVADLQATTLDRVGRLYPLIRKRTQDYTDLFHADLDAVVVVTPPETHHAIARACLEHGLHVMVEKPLALSAADAFDLVRLAERNDRILMVGHTFEYNAAVDVLSDLVRGGDLGRIYYIDCVRASLGLYQNHTSVLWDLGPHDISILRRVLGTEPIEVSAHGNCCVQDGIEDVVYLSLRFPNDVLAHCRLSWLDPHKTRRITVVGSDKMVVYDDTDTQEKIRIFHKGVQAHRQNDTYGDFAFAYHHGAVVSPHIEFEEPLRRQCRHFIESVSQGTWPLTDGASGLAVVRILEAAQASLDRAGSFAATYPELGIVRHEPTSGPGGVSWSQPGSVPTNPHRQGD